LILILLANKEPELVPMTFAEAKQQGKTFHLSKVLADSGGTRSSIARSSIPSGCEIRKKDKPFSAVTSAGTMDHYEFVHFDKVFLPEFCRSRWIEDVEFVVFEDKGHSAYNAILGRDVLDKAGIDVKFSSKEVVWDEHTIPFHPRLQPVRPLTPEDPSSVLNVFEDSFASSESLKPSDYNVKTTGKDIADHQTHLIPQHRTALAAMLAKHDEMFNRVLGKYPDGTVRLQVVPGVSPIHCKPFSVPHRNLKQLKREIDTLVLLDVVEPILISEWAFPSFLVPKKDGTARFVSDFRRLNEVLLDEKHDLPRIRDVLQRRSGFDFVTTIDITSQFYHFALDPESRKYVVITTPFGKYRYKRLPMGIKIAPAYAQAVMTKLFKDLMDFVECFMDDLAVFTKGTFEQHLKDVDLVLSRLNAANFSIKAKKCHFAVQRVEYLGHIITPQGIEPQPQKVAAILQIASPKTPKQLRQFIGMVNYYRDHIPRRSHLLAPLTAQTKNKKQLNWTAECEKSFQAIKSKLAQDCMLSYPDPTYPFVLEPDSSDYQLGAIILQNVKDKLSVNEIIALFTAKPDKLPPNFKPIAYFSRKLSSAQRNYTTLEKELLSFVETLLEYRSILLGCPIIIFTDHRNLTFAGPSSTQSQRALRWRLVIEEFNVTIVHRAGASNFAADALSRLPLLEPEEPSSVRQAQERFDDSYLFYPVQDRMHAPCPVTLANIQALQNADAHLQQIANRNNTNYCRVDFGDISLIQFRLANDGPWRIVLPMALIPSALRWFHQLLLHPGATRMLLTINKHFTFPRMRSVIEDFVSKCDVCQRTKRSTTRDGLLPLKDPELDPWYQVQVDLIGPWEVNLGPGMKLSIRAFSAIDPFIGLCELSPIKNPTCAHVGTIFHNCWLCRYPTPTRCVHDNGPEFISQEFQDILRYYGIKDAPTTVKNPQANAIVERAHLTMASMLRTMVLETTNGNRRLLPQDIDDFVSTALACTQRAINATVHSITKESPGAFIFQRDMLLPIQSFANWELARAKRSENNVKNLFSENQRRRPFDWQPGMNVLLENTRHKMDPKFIGPFPITRVHTNGTVTIRRGNTFQRVNIRWIKLYHHPD
jgi:Reverse transcriptase (RNA-dependent DNA polymerase)./Integrase core domain.